MPSVDGFAAIRSVGFEPAQQVFGATVVPLALATGVGCPGTGARHGMRPHEASDAGMTIVSGSGVPGPVNRIAQVLYDGRRRALDRMTAECADLGGHGVVGASVQVREIPAEMLTAAALEFTVIGTAVRAPGCPPPSGPFTCDLPGQDFAKLIMTGWLPVGVVLGISVAARHDDLLATHSSRWGPGNAEVPGYTDLIASVRRDARSQAESEVRGLGADGVVVSAMTVRARGDACQAHPGGTDHVAEAVITGTAVTRFSTRSRMASLAILPLDRLGGQPRRTYRDQRDQDKNPYQAWNDVPVLVGRGRELALLADCLARGRPVVLVGEAGVGKTTALRAAAMTTGRKVFEGGGLSTLSWMECLPLRRAVGDSLTAADAAAVATQVQRVVKDGVLLLDDLHWSDVMTVEATALLGGHCGLLTAVRRGDPGTPAVLDRVVDAGFVQVDLAPLPADESAHLVKNARPDLPDAAVSRLVLRAGGNPLLLLELARTPQPSPSLRLLLAARLRLLSPAGRDAFCLLALAGRPLAIQVLGEAGANDLLQADLAVTVAGPAELALRHALLAEVAVEMLGPAEQRALHARLAEAATAPGEAARHYAQAGADDLAFVAAIRAADEATRPGERASHLALAASVATGPAGDELRLRAARALDEAYDWAGVKSVLAAVASQDAEVTAWSQLLLARGAWADGDVDALRMALTEGLAAAAGTGSEVEVRLRIEQSRLPIFVDCDLAGGVAMARAALDLAKRSGVDVPRAEYLLGTALAVADQPGGGEHLRSALDGARAAGDVHTEFLAANNLVSYEESGGSPQRAREVALDMIGRAAELGLGYWESAMRATVVNLDANQGAYHNVVDAAEELLDQPLDARTRDMLIECLGLALTDLGRADEAIRRLEAEQANAIPDYRGQGQLLWVLAEASLWSGRPDRALELLDDFMDGPADDPNRVLGRVTQAWARVELGQDPGPPVPPHERPMLLGARPETEALGLFHRGDHAAAAELFEQAATYWAPYHRRGELRCAWAAGEARRRLGDLPSAIKQLELAESAARELAAALFLARIHRSLRAAGQRRSAPRSGRRGGLTDRERQVLDFVRKGLTNAQIATQLGITQRTVVALIASAVSELGATNRGHAAALASEN